MRFLSHPDDVAKLERSIEIARAAAHSPALKPFIVREVAPGGGRTLKGQELANFVRDGATTYFLSSPISRIGPSNPAVRSVLATCEPARDAPMIRTSSGFDFEVKSYPPSRVVSALTKIHAASHDSLNLQRSLRASLCQAVVTASPCFTSSATSFFRVLRNPVFP